MIVRPLVARAFFALSRYRLRTEPAPRGPALMIVAPHTSNADFLLAVATWWRLGIRPTWLGKHTLFSGPLGGLYRALGGAPLDRTRPEGQVEAIVGRFRASGDLLLVLSPEGTRFRGTHWKSGFYRIAREADVPVVLCYFDSVTRTTGLGPTLRLTGDVGADMDRIRAFYAGMKGLRPERTTPPRLRMENAP